MKTTGIAIVLVGVLLLTSVGATHGLDVTLDSGAGSTTLVDNDGDGIIDFDLTVGGVLLARGRVFEQINAVTRVVSITATPPLPAGVFRNVGGGDATFTVTVNSSTFGAAGPPLGWSVFYNGTATDEMSGPVNIPSHSVEALVNDASISLTTLVGTAITAAGDIDLSATGIDPAAAATNVRIIFAFTAGPDDEILLPDNNGVDGDAIQVSVFNQEGRCIDKMNNDARQVVDRAQKSDSACVNDGVRADGANETTCVDDPGDEKTEKKETKLIKDFDTFCAANVPSWGVNAERCCEDSTNDGSVCSADDACPGGACVRGACISGAAEQAANAVTHDLFGATVNVTDGSDTGKCQKQIIKMTGKLLVEHWRVLRSCKKDNFGTISDDSGLVATCLGPPQPDPRGKIAKRLTKLTDSVAKRCVAEGVTPVGPAFPGACTGASDPSFAACVNARVNCRFCLAVDAADAIVPPLDCDLFDDGMANGSCP